MLSAVISLGGMGFVAGLGLAFASKKLAMDIDPRIEEIENLLPGANCGACGYPGCSTFARSVLKHETEPYKCLSINDETIYKISEVVGVKAKTALNLVAAVHCRGGRGEAPSHFIYQGIGTCKAAALIAGGHKKCKYGCLGWGSCEKACPFDAITMDENRLPVIRRKICVGCGKCMEACPNGLISLVPNDQYIVVGCNSNARGNVIKKVCTTGCTGCGTCEKICPFDAVVVVNNLAVIDYQRCTNCGLCVLKCPFGSISDLSDFSSRAKILEERCTGCTLCLKVCPTEAIEGKPKKIHHIDSKKCIGCGFCREICKNKAIELKNKSAF